MILDQVFVLAAVIAVLWFLYRWGALIFALYAVWHFVMGEWTSAGMALFFAWLVEFLTSAAGRRGLIFWYVAFRGFSPPRDRWWR